MVSTITVTLGTLEMIGEDKRNVRPRGARGRSGIREEVGRQNTFTSNVVD